MSWWGILENIISDILFIALAIIVAWAWTQYTQRRILQKFFNISESKRLTIYLSNIKVLPFGAIGTAGKKMSYQGETIAYGEIQAANQIYKLFSFIIPKLTEVSQNIGKLLLSDVNVQILVSPSEKNSLESQAPIISLGSPAYNTGSLYIGQLEKNIVHFRFGSTTLAELQEEGYVHPPSGSFSDTDTQQYGNPPVYNSNTIEVSVKTVLFPEPGTVSFGLKDIQNRQGKPQNPEPPAILVNGLPPITDTAYGFVERLQDEKKRCFFYIAGLSEFATKQAGHYLASEWRSLYKKYGENKSFLIMLQIGHSAADR